MPMETNLVIDMVPRIQVSHSYSTVKSNTIVSLKRQKYLFNSKNISSRAAMTKYFWHEHN